MSKPTFDQIVERLLQAQSRPGSAIRSEIYVEDLVVMMEAHNVNRLTIERLGSALQTIRERAVMMNDRFVLDWCDKALSPIGMPP